MKIKHSIKQIQNEKGIALISMLLFLVVLTVIGLTSISITSIENKTAKNERVYETRMNINEAGTGVQVKLVEETMINGSIPLAYLSTSGGPVVTTANLQNEILVQATEIDTAGATGALGSDLIMSIGSHTVNMDIDYIFTRPKAGTAILFAEASGGAGTGAASGGTETYYQFVAESTVGEGTGTITNIYNCVVSNGCQK